MRAEGVGAGGAEAEEAPGKPPDLIVVRPAPCRIPAIASGVGRDGPIGIFRGGALQA